ncbi:Cell division cycle 7-related protein kinase-like isoform X2 [Oopsacas minuta]|uniref:non-specific serine/threonine protein kinase n=1 Tax=Oopsacas minuta TaxID=111878 RepID=A0AAV7K158_9METZ|nr:Cell division cycle 7-related protein kinase-like isoform X2 [Oopsacas minuta]
MATEQTAIEEQQQQKVSEIFEKFPEITENFHNFTRIGEGTFSTVYQGIYINENNFSLAFKVLVPTSGPDRVEKEIQMLRVLNGQQNVITLLTCMRQEDIYILVMPHFPHQKFQTFFLTFTTQDTQKYMRALLEAIQHVHKFNIIHRDIKPSNFLYNRISGQCRLVDFGLAQYLGVSNDATTEIREISTPLSRFKENEHSSKKRLPDSIGCNNRHSDIEVCNICNGRPSQQVSRAGTPGFRAPEVLLKYSPHTVLIDMWAAGIILISILSRRYPFFKSQDDITALGHITTIFGTEAVQIAARAMNKKLTCQPYVKGFELSHLCRELRGVISQAGKINTPETNKSIISPKTISDIQEVNTSQPGTPRRSIRLKHKDTGSTDSSVICEKVKEDKRSADPYPDDVYDLLKAMLELNPKVRLTANKALEHAFFKIDFTEQKVADYAEE